MRTSPAGRISMAVGSGKAARSEEHTSELQSQSNLVCRLLLEKKNNKVTTDSDATAMLTNHGKILQDKQLPCTVVQLLGRKAVFLMNRTHHYVRRVNVQLELTDVV